MSKFVSIVDKNEQKHVINIDHITTLNPYSNDWLQGAVIHLKSGTSIYLNPIPGQDLRDFLLSL